MANETRMTVRLDPTPLGSTGRRVPARRQTQHRTGRRAFEALATHPPTATIPLTTAATTRNNPLATLTRQSVRNPG